MAVLTPEQQTQYYASQNTATNPLSPTQWLAQQTSSSTSSTSTPAISSAFLTPEQYQSVLSAQKLISQPIAADSLNQNQQLVQGAVQPTQSQIQPDSIAELIKNYQTQENTQAQEDYASIDSLYSTVGNLISQQGQESVRQGELNQSLGVNDITGKINEIDKLLGSYQSAAKEAITRSENRLAPQFAIVGEQAAIDRQLSFKTYGLAAAKSALQGDLALAQERVQQALDAEFKPLQSKIDYQMLLIQKNQDRMTAEQKRRADAFSLQLQQKQSELADRKTNREQVLSLLTQAASNKEIPTSVISQFLNNPDISYVQAVQALSPYLTPVQKVSVSSGITGGTGGGTTGGTTPFASDLDALIAVTKGNITSKFGQDQFQDTINRARNDADKINAIATLVLKGSSAEVRSDFINQASGVQNIDKAISLLDQQTQTGVVQNGLQYTFNLFGKDFDPKLAAIQTYITSAIQPYRSSITGAAWGDQEDAEYAQLFGSTKFSPAELKSRLERIKDILVSKSTNALNAQINPLGTYGNVFSGQEDINTQNYGDDQVFDSVVNTGESKPWYVNLWNSIFG